MADYNEEGTREGRRVTLAWIILALQVIGLIWLLLFARDRLAAMMGAEPAATVAPTAVAAIEEPAVEEPAAQQPTADSAATADAEAAAAPTDEPTAEPTAAPVDTADDAEVLAPADVAVDPSALAPTGGVQAPEWLAQIVQGVPPAEAAEGVGIPPHLLLTFRDPQQPELELATPDSIDLNQPQIRIVPIATLLAWLQARGDTAGQEALEELQSLLDEQPPAGEASAPTPPILSDATQAMVVEMAYGQFHDGQGVGYVAHVTGQDVTPVTNESGLNYVYQGLTADGRHYVFMAWPMEADFLAEDAAEAETELAADPAAYYDAVAAQVEDAADDAMTPPLAQLRRVAGSLAIGAAAVRAAAGPAAQTQPTASPADAAGIVWNWTGSRGGDGDETTVENPQDYALVFWPDGSFNFMADCNVGRGDYSVADDGTLSLEPGAMTRAACDPGSQDVEFLQTLPAARSLAFDESGDMILTLADGREAIFANTGQADTAADATEPEDQPAAADAGFTGVNLHWPGFTAADGTTVAVANPEDYSLLLLPDGTYTIRADCNVGAGTFTYDDGALTLVPGPLTRAACRAGSQAGAFLEFLGGVSGATVGGDGAVMMTTADGGSATFVNAGPAEAPATDTAAQEGDLLNTLWQWTAHVDASATATAVANPERYTLAFLDDGTYLFVADCNSGSGSYTRDGETLTLLPGAMTLAACEAGSLSDEFTAFFERVVSYTLEGDTLLLTLDDGTALALANGGPFDATAAGGTIDAPEGGNAAPLAGVTWRWATFRDAKQEYAVPATTDYTLVFNDDGAVNVVADCNSGNGTYTVNSDGTLTIVVRATTDAACPAGSLGDSFVEYLNQAGPFQVGEDGVLTIELMADGGTMTFVPEP
jgi:heat shock protein HslJ